MISKEDAKKYLDMALSNGADYCDFFFERTKSLSISARSGKVREADYDILYGFGIRLMQGEDVVYGYESGFSIQAFEKLLKNLMGTFKGNATKCANFNDEKNFPSKSKIKIDEVKPSEKRDFLIDITNKILEKDEKIIEADARINQSEQEVLIINSKGTYQHDFRPYIRVVITALAKDEKSGALENSYRIYSKQGGYELVKDTDFSKGIDEISKTAVDLLKAEKIVPGKYPVILDNGFGGVIFHEACGHPLEASAISLGLSPFVGKIGEEIANPILSAYDDGTIKGAWGHLNIDDEGNFPTKNLLIENGILKNYMVDYKNGLKIDKKPTGCSRRESYKYAPTSRMTSTYIAPGKSKKEDLFKGVKLGIYAKSLGGGQVSPATGEFNFGISEGYYVRDGKICELVKGAMLIGHGADILKQIDMIADNCALGEGICGASSGNIPVDVGQPTIRVQNLIVGGGKND